MHNTLTELAERISKIKTPPTFYVSMEDYHTACNDLVKASQIITELAKADPDRWPMCVQAIIDCREIAAEGDNNG